jgi:hypothetical protein
VIDGPNTAASPLAVSDRPGLSKLVLLLALLVLAWTCWDGRLHWDEPGYLYTGTYLSVPEIIAGNFQPSQIDGFSVSRLLHVLFVKAVTTAVGPGLLALGLVIGSYALLLMATALLGYLILRHWIADRRILQPAVLIACFSPMFVYLLFKTTPDIPSLFFSTLASLALLRSLTGRALPWLAITAVALLGVGLTKHVMAWQYVAFVVATALFGGLDVRLRKLATHVLGSGIAALGLFMLVLAAAGIPLGHFLYFLGVASQAGEPLIAKLLHIGMSLGLLWLCVPLALFARDRRLVVFFIAWLALAIVPLILVLPRIEIRYLMTGFVPLAGIVFLALQTLAAWLDPWLRRRPRTAGITAALVAAILVLSSQAAQLLTAHEVRMDQLHALIGQLEERADGRPYAVLTPWAYTDFHYLRVAYPDLPVYNVSSKDASIDDSDFYGPRRIDDLAALSALPERLFYLGFDEAFPVHNIAELAGWLPPALEQPIKAKLDTFSLVEHLKTSWMWDDPAVSLVESGGLGHYRIFEVQLQIERG